MILITGNDSIVDHLGTALESLGHACRRTDQLDADLVREQRATRLVYIEPLPRVATAPPASDRGLREVISAANAPGVRRAIIVTPRPDADAELRAVRRSGIPYTILRPRPLLERPSDANRPVLVPRELATSLAAAVTADMVVDAVVGAFDDGRCGQTLDVVPPDGMTWSDLLARAGITPKPVPTWRARVGRWFGARTLDVAMPA